MFLHPRNDTVETRARIAALDVRSESLRRVLHPEPCLEDAQERLDLAGILCWRGLYRQTMELVQPLNSEDFPAEVAFQARQLIGDNYYRHDQYDLASKHYHECLEQARRAGHDYWAARAQDGIAWVLVDVGHYSTGEFQEAEKIFAKLEPMHRARGEWGPEAMAIYGLSRAAAGMGQYSRAIDEAHRAIDLLDANDGEFLLQLPLLQLANVHRDRGDFDEARPVYEAALDAADRSQDPYFQALTALSYGNQLKYQKQIEAAVELWRSVLGMIDELDFPRIGNEICSRLAKLAVDGGDFEEAYRRQVDSQAYGNKVGVISSILSNQQMLLREQMHESAQLEDALNYLRTGVEVTADGIFILERQADGIDKDEFVIRFVNESAAAMTGNTPLNIIHVLIKSVWRTPSAALLLEPSLQVHATGKPCTLDPVELEFDEGIKGWYAVKIAKIPSGVVWTVSDVSAREAMQREILAQSDRLSEANARLTALDREKSEMLGIAAHDLRSPIGNIRSLSELITTDDPESAELLQTIGEISDSLLTLIGNLLDVERIERGEMELKLSELEVAPLLSEVVAQFSAEAAHKGIALRLALAGEPLSIGADESALRRVLQNLISNALKFSPPGAPVWVRMGLKGVKARIEIEDRGCGITEADRKRLFSKFAKLSARPTAGESSTGLGLSIVKRLVEAMGGQVGCDSEPGSGATFWIEFETVPAELTAAA